MMSDDELPPISVNTSRQNPSSFMMPPADVVASQRAREEQHEHELRQLRVREDVECDAGGGAWVRSDSSESEGEAALTAAVRALRVCARGPSGADGTELDSAARALLAALPLLPDGRLLREYLRHADAALAQPGLLYYLADQTERSIGNLIASSEGDAAPAAEERDALLACGVWLAAHAVLPPAPHPAAPHPALWARCRRSLHALLARADPQQTARLARVLCAALPPALWLRAADAARVCAGRGAEDALAHALTRAALAASSLQPLAPPCDARPLTPQEVWASVGGAGQQRDAGARLTVLRAAGRALAAAAGEGGVLSGAALEDTAGGAGAGHSLAPDELRVQLTMSRIHLLFGIKH